MTIVQEPVLEILEAARRIANFAERAGINVQPVPSRTAMCHLGAILADAILQSGLNYRTVVKSRVDRIVDRFPEATTLTGVRAVIDNGLVSDFLLWRHPTKVDRFTLLTDFLWREGIDMTADLKQWLNHRDARERLLCLQGVGPKTFDYLCCLTGIDCIAVDRHIKAFAAEAGVHLSGYDGLKASTSFAADLLGIARRDFDAWIWSAVSRRTLVQRSLAV